MKYKLNSIEFKVITMEFKVNPIEFKVNPMDIKVNSMKLRFISLEPRVNWKNRTGIQSESDEIEGEFDGTLSEVELNSGAFKQIKNKWMKQNLKWIQITSKWIRRYSRRIQWHCGTKS